MTVKIQLGLPQLRIAAMVGVERNLESLCRRSPDTIPTPDPWKAHIEGAAAEAAVGKALGIFWGGDVNTFKAPDLEGWQVRATDRPGGCLIVRPKDRDGDRFILVIVSIPVFDVVGWIYGREAKRPEWFRDSGPPAWFVPQGALRPIGKVER